MKLSRKLRYLFKSGKNSKLAYYLKAYWTIGLPWGYLQWRRRRAMASLHLREDREQIQERVDYYCRLLEGQPFDAEKFLAESIPLEKQKKTGQTVYYLDAFRDAKSFPRNLHWILLPGDITYIPGLPSIVKSRPITPNLENANSVLLNLDRVRHFLFLKDKKVFAEKKDQVIFRGLIGQEIGNSLKQNRYDFMKRYFGHPLCDAGVLDREYPEWFTEKLTIGEHLDYKFIMALEGNDVASNLKWIMSSNSIAVMPRPTYESWFMEGRLIPNVHYIEIKSDFSDLEERLSYYIAHPKEAELILANANAYVAQFFDEERETLIAWKVLERYFTFTNRDSKV